MEVYESNTSFVDLVKNLHIKINDLETKVEQLTEELQGVKLSVGGGGSGSGSIHTNSIASTTSPDYNFKDLPNKIVIRKQHIESLKDCNITQIMINILEEMKLPLPLLCLTNKLYVYSEQGTWRECANEELIRFLNKVHQKFVKEMCDWYAENKDEINATDHMCVVYNKMMIKLMGIDFKNKSVLSKIKSNLCKHLKSVGGGLLEGAA
jgi:hypothetical protein